MHVHAASEGEKTVNNGYCWTKERARLAGLEMEEGKAVNVHGIPVYVSPVRESRSTIRACRTLKLN